MTEDERKAHDWLALQETTYSSMLPGSLGYSYLESIRTLRSMLSRVMPEEPSTEALEAMRDGIFRAARCTAFDHTVEAAYRALYAHLTAPKTKTVEVWHVEYTVWACNDGWQPRVEVCGDKVIAEARALKFRDLNGMSAIRVTGPHSQEVPRAGCSWLLPPITPAPPFLGA